jgi:hypothetical protein
VFKIGWGIDGRQQWAGRDVHFGLKFIIYKNTALNHEP